MILNRIKLFYLKPAIVAFFLLLALVLTSSFVQANTLLTNNSGVWSGTSSMSDFYGVKVVANQRTNLVSVNLSPSSTCPRILVVNNSNYAILANVSVVSREATFTNLILEAGQVFRVVESASGSNCAGSQNHAYLALSNTQINITAGTYDLAPLGGGFTDSGVNTWAIEYIVTNDVFISPPFTISAQSSNSSSISIFNATIAGTTYTTTNGTINTPYNATSGVFNITVNAANYFSQTYTNYNVSSNLQAQLYQAILSLNATEIITNSSLSGATFTIGSQTNTTFFLNAGTYTVTVNKAGYYTKTAQVTVSALQNSSQTITGVYPVVLNITATNVLSSSQINNFFVTARLTNTSYAGYETNGTTTNGFFGFGLISGQYNVSIDAAGYQTQSVLVNTSGNYSLYNFSLYTTNSIDITFKDEITGVLLSGPVISAEFISSVFATNRTTTNGTIYIDLLSPSDYTVRYYATGFDTRQYYFTLTNRSYNPLTLYLLNTSVSTDVTATVYNENANPVEDITIQVLKYDITTNTYILREEITTNFGGQAILHLVQNSEYYKFILLDSDGTVLLETTPTYIFATSLTFQVVLGATGGETYFKVQGVSNSLTFNNNTNNFRFTYADGGGLATEACLYVYKMSYSGDTLLDSSCNSGASGTVLVAISPENGTSYHAQTTVSFNSDTYPLNELIITFPNTRSFRQLGLFLAYLMILTVALVFARNVAITLFLVPTPLALAIVLGLVTLNFGVYVSLQVVFMILAVVVSRNA